MKKDLKQFKSAYFFGPKKIKIINQKFKNSKDNFLIIKVNSCMICGSDLRIFKEGSPRINVPRIIGHETSGVVVFSKMKKIKVGDRISLGADIDKKINFAFGYEVDGGFSQYMFLNKKIALKAPIAKFKKNISFDEAALAEPLACCINGFEKVKFRENKTVTIFGAGPIGLMIGLLAKNFKSRKIFLVDINLKRLKRAKKILKCETILFMKNNFIKKFYKKNKGFGSDYIFTANPSIETHKFALKIANKESFINFFGGVSKKNSKLLIDSNFIHYNEINLTGSHGSSHRQHKKALRMIENKKINLKPLITHKYNLKDINKAYKISLSGKAIKVSIRPN
tara:strand:+ start:4188 stop:5201 length:1014 start_codon:yes stop_codon:yes gene_type:complete